MILKGFDNRKYLSLQSEKIEERIAAFGDKLYLEFGGKLFDDYHASRVLPGFEPDSKIKMLLKLKDIAEVLIVIFQTTLRKISTVATLVSPTTPTFCACWKCSKRRACTWAAS